MLSWKPKSWCKNCWYLVGVGSLTFLFHLAIYINVYRISISFYVFFLFEGRSLDSMEVRARWVHHFGMCSWIKYWVNPVRSASADAFLLPPYSPCCDIWQIPTIYICICVLWISSSCWRYNILTERSGSGTSAFLPWYTADTLLAINHFVFVSAIVLKVKAVRGYIATLIDKGSRDLEGWLTVHRVCTWTVDLASWVCFAVGMSITKWSIPKG